MCQSMKYRVLNGSLIHWRCCWSTSWVFKFHKKIIWSGLSYFVSISIIYVTYLTAHTYILLSHTRIILDLYPCLIVMDVRYRYHWRQKLLKLWLICLTCFWMPGYNFMWARIRVRWKKGTNKAHIHTCTSWGISLRLDRKLSYILSVYVDPYVSMKILSKNVVQFLTESFVFCSFFCLLKTFF